MILMSLMFFGCSKQSEISPNSFLLTTKAMLAGGVCQEISIPTLENEILKENSQEKFDKFLNKLLIGVEQKLYNNYYLRYWIKYVENPKKEYIIGGENVKFLRPQISEDKLNISFSLNFLTNDAWKFYSQAPVSTAKVENEKIFFLKKMESQTTFPFNDNELKNYYLNILQDALHSCDIKLDTNDATINFAYKYITPYGKIKSNADCKYETKEGYCHLWEQSQKTDEKKEIKIWVNNINAGFWYLIVFAIFFIISTIFFVVLYVRPKTKYKNSKHT